MLTELECRTVDALYPDRDGYFEFLWQLSDRVQEESETAAEGLRFLHAVEQRPYGGTHTYWWCRTRGENIAEEAEVYRDLGRDSFRNYIPSAIGLGTNKGFSLVSVALEEFLIRWCGLNSETRQRITEEWTREVVNAN